MTTTNILQAVATLQDAELGFLENTQPLISLTNKEFDNFQDFVGNLGRSVTYTKPYRAIAVRGLVASDQPIDQRFGTLTVSQSSNVSMPMTSEEILFNTEKYMKDIGEGQVMEIASEVEADISLNAVSGVVSEIDGSTNTESGPYRFFGNGRTDIVSYQQLAQAYANFVDFGCPKSDIKMVIPLTKEPAIVGSGLNQFAPKRNDELANTWEIGRFQNVDYYRSNLLPLHTAGTLGNDSATLTVVSINAAGTQMICSGAGTDADAVHAGDLGQFDDTTGLKFLTFIGHKVSDQPVQFRVTADAASSGGNVTLNITPALISTSGINTQNINKAIVAGMTLQLMPNHRAGLLFYRPAFFMGNPKLPPEKPFDSVSKISENGVSLRTSYGSTLGANTTRLIHYSAWGSELDKDYSMRVLFRA